MHFFAAIGCVVMSWPQTIAVPAVGARKPVIIFIVVDLPAPFGPRKPSTSPRGTVKEMSSTAFSGPKCLTRCRISSMALSSVQIAETLYQHDGRFVLFAAGSGAACSSLGRRSDKGSQGPMTRDFVPRHCLGPGLW